jgi:hypothetical protein
MSRIKSCPCEPVLPSACKSCGVRYDTVKEQLLVPLRPDWEIMEIDDLKIVLGKK